MPSSWPGCDGSSKCIQGQTVRWTTAASRSTQEEVNEDSPRHEVATRPRDNNGLGMTVAKTDAAVSQSMAVFRLLLDERGIFSHWRDLVAGNDVKGKNAHDARLVAAMQRHGLSHLLSFNKPDFVRFTEIANFTPADVLDGRIPSPAPTSV